MKRLRTIHDVPTEEWKGKRVLLRVDLNAAVDDDGRPVPDGEQRLEGSLPTIRTLRDAGARVILLSHLGRPGGRVVEHLRLAGVMRRCAEILGTPIRALSEVLGATVDAAVRVLGEGEIVALENLRFHPGEEANDEAFAHALAALGDCVVHDAFGVVHRAHASVARLPRLRPSTAGILLAREVEVLGGILDRPQRPAVAIVSGAKLETKVGMLSALLPRMDHILTGGGVANTLLQADGVTIGQSLADAAAMPTLGHLRQELRRKVLLPVDVRVRRAGHEAPLVLRTEQLTPADTILDVGPETVARYCTVLQTANTVVWNGPLGKFEDAGFDQGTADLAQCLRGTSARSVVGGGDTVRALAALGALDAFDHVSTGGGAMLAFLEGALLPGLEPLYD